MIKSETMELVQVEYNEGKTKATLTFYSEDEGHIRDVGLQTQGFDRESEKFFDDPEKEAKTKGYVKEALGVDWDSINTVTGQSFEVYIYDNFNHIVEFDIPEKFDPADKGSLYSCTIVDIKDNTSMNRIEIKVKIEDKSYQVNMSYSKRVPINGEYKYLKDPDKLERQLKNFETKFGVPFDRKDEVIGKDTMVEVKVFSGNAYGELKKLK